MPRRRTRPFQSPPPPSPDPQSIYQSPHYSFDQSPENVPAAIEVVSPFVPSRSLVVSPVETRVSSPEPSARAYSVHAPSPPGYSPPPSIRSCAPSIQPPNVSTPRCLPQSPELPSRKNSSLDLRTMYEENHMIMHSPATPAASLPESPAWISPIPISGSRTQHGDYYLEDGVVFLANNILFKVPRYMLNQESDVFHRLYSSQFDPRGKGSIDTNPIILTDVKAGEFQYLLTVLYPREIAEQARVTHSWTEAEWQSVLHLAVVWEMPRVRNLAIQTLSWCAGSLKKILLGRQYDINPWIRAGFLDLCLRDNPLTEEEGSQIGWKDILKISRAREMIRFKAIKLERHEEWESTKYGECCAFKTRYDSAKYTRNMMVHDILDEIFGLEDLADIGSRAPSRSSWMG